MTQVKEMQRLIRAVRGQLQAELTLGARWLPLGRVSLAGAARPASGGRAAAPSAPAGSAARKPAVQAGAGRAPAARPAAAEIPVPHVRTSDPRVLEKQRRLEAIAQQVRQCTKCPLHQTRTNPVPGEGNPEALIVFVGEAPGADEDAQGRPFVGRAGKLLTQIIEAMGLRREDVYIANVLKSRPPNNREPSALEMAACIGYLYEQIEIIAPKMIVALGACAARALLNTPAAIGQLRGRFHELRTQPLGPALKVRATYHPAYLLRSYLPENRRRVWEDMQAVLRELGLPVPPRRKQEP